MPLINLPQRRQAGLQGKTLCLLPVDRNRAPATVTLSVDVVRKAFRRDREEVTSFAILPSYAWLAGPPPPLYEEFEGSDGCSQGAFRSLWRANWSRLGICVSRSKPNSSPLAHLTVPCITRISVGLSVGQMHSRRCVPTSTGIRPVTRQPLSCTSTMLPWPTSSPLP